MENILVNKPLETTTRGQTLTINEMFSLQIFESYYAVKGYIVDFNDHNLIFQNVC